MRLLPAAALLLLAPLTDANDWTLELMAETGSTLSTVDEWVAINAAGTVAFTGRNATGDSRLWIAETAGQPVPIAPHQSGLEYLGAAINDLSPPQVATRARFIGNPPVFKIYKFPADGSAAGSLPPATLVGTSPLDFSSAQSFLDINDEVGGSAISEQGIVCWQALTGSTVLLQAQYSAPPNTISSFPPLYSLRPQLTNRNTIQGQGAAMEAIVQGTFGGQPHIVIYNLQSATGIAIAGPGAGQSVTSRWPGIAKNGSTAAYVAHQPGFEEATIVFRYGGFFWPRVVARVGQDGFTAIDPDMRIAVASVGVLPAGQNHTLLFRATRNGKSGIFGAAVRSWVIAQNVQWTVDSIDLVVEEGQSIAGRTIATTSLFHPLNSSDVAAVRVTFTDGGQGVVRAWGRIQPIEGGVRSELTIKQAPASPPQVFVGGVAATDVRAYPASPTGTKLYFTAPPRPAGIHDLSVALSGGQSATLSKIRYTEDLIDGVKAVGRGLRTYYEELLRPDSPALADEGPKAGAIAETVLLGISHRASPANAAESAELASVLEDLLGELRSTINGAAGAPTAPLSAGIRLASFGQTVHFPVGAPAETTLLTLGSGSLVLTQDSGAINQVPASGGEIVLPSQMSGDWSQLVGVSGQHDGWYDGWTYTIELDNDPANQAPGLQISNLDYRPESPLLSDQKVARRLSIPAIHVYSGGQDLLYRLRPEHLQHLWMHDNTEAHLPHAHGQTTYMGTGHVEELHERIVTAVYRIPLDDTPPQNNQEESSLVVRAQYAFSNPYEDFEPTQCVEFAHVFPGASASLYLPPGSPFPSTVDSVRIDHRVHVAPTSSPFQSEWDLGLFKDSDNIVQWIPKVPTAFGSAVSGLAPLLANLACQPSPFWDDLFDLSRTRAPVTHAAAGMTDASVDNIHVTPVRAKEEATLGAAAFIAFWSTTGPPSPAMPIGTLASNFLATIPEAKMEAPGSFPGTLHFHWRWGSQLGAGMGGGESFVPQGQVWRLGITGAPATQSPSDFEAELLALGAVAYGDNPAAPAVSKLEKVIYIGAEQTITSPSQAFQTFGTGFGMAQGPTNPLCAFLNVQLYLGGYGVISNPQSIHAKVAKKLSEAVLFQPSGGPPPDCLEPTSPLVGGASGPCGDTIFDPKLQSGSTPGSQTVGQTLVSISSSPLADAFSAHTPPFLSALGFALAEQENMPGNSLQIDFTPPVNSVLNLPLAVRDNSSVDQGLLIDVFSGGALVQTLAPVATHPVQRAFAQVIVDVDLGVPIERLVLRSADPGKSFAVGSFRLCDAPLSSGDVNHDGLINAADLDAFDLMAPWVGLPLPPQLRSADLDGNAQLDCNDLSLLAALVGVSGTLPDADGDGTPDACDSCPSLAVETGQDCDGDGIDDGCAIATGQVADCNGNGVPDSCDITGLAAADCDFDGVLDSCELLAGTQVDLDGDGVPDDCAPLTVDGSTISISTGGVRTFSLNAGTGRSGSLYFLLASTSGTTPGIPLGGVVIPLAFPDPLFNISLNNANSPPFEANQGLLAVPTGHARSRFGFAAGLPLSLTGADISFAYVTLDLQTLAATSASNPVTIEITP